MSNSPPLLAIIDDDASVLLAMRMLLESRGFRVIAGENEDHILDHLSAGGEVPDAIVADYRLRQGRTGIEAVRHIRARAGQPIPGLIITGDTSSGWVDEAKALRLTVLQKPVLPVQLSAALSKVMG